MPSCQTVYKRKNKSLCEWEKENFFLGATAGAAAGGTIGYFTKPLFKNGAPTDEFVHKVFSAQQEKRFAEEGTRVMEIADTLTAIDELKKLKDKNLSVEEIKKYMKRYNETFKETLSELKTDDEIKEYFEKLINSYKEMFSDIKANITKVYDSTTKTLNLDKIEKEMAETIESAGKRVKFGAAAKWGAISAAALGTIALVASKISANKNNA